MDPKEKERQKRETPIIDGDARPDMPTDPAMEKKKKEKKELPLGKRNYHGKDLSFIRICRKDINA